LGAKRILALGSVAALCAGAAAPLFVASTASADPVAHSICITYQVTLSPGNDVFAAPIYGVNLSDAACNAFSSSAVNLSFDNAVPGPQGGTGPAGITGPSGPAGVTGGTGGTGLRGAPGLPGPQGPQGVTGAQGGTGLQGGTGAGGGAGSAGTTGSQGLVGNDGPQGGTGIQGGPGPVGPSGGVPAVTLVVGPVLAPTIGGATFAGNVTPMSSANCPAGTILLGGGGHVGLTQGAGGALSASFPSGQSWLAGATVTHAAPKGTITVQAYAFCQNQT
jgi:hypothetical protein